MTNLPQPPADGDVERAATASLHPDCPDWRRLGPTTRDAALRAAAARQRADLEEREGAWSRGFNRRSVLAGGMGAGVAALGSQLVTTRVSYAAPGDNAGTLVVVFLRGGMDGLSVLVPAGDPNLLKARPGIAIRGGNLIGMGRGFALHPSLKDLKPLVSAGQLAAVPALSTPDLSRSHFQAQDCLERGGSATGAQTGWLDRVLAAAGPGTTFRGVAVGGGLPRALAGTQGPIAMRKLKDVRVEGSDHVSAETQKAIAALYTGVENPIAAHSMLGLEAITSAKKLTGPKALRSAVNYPKGDFADSLKDLASLIKSGTGVRVACVDVGGWDMHTQLTGDMETQLAELGAALAAFTKDLGSQLSNTTVVTMSEFGRRLEQNGTNGTDHGHGGVSLVLGGGVRGGVHGKWVGLGKNVLDQGDVPGSNDYRDLLSEVVTARLGLSGGALSGVFPGWKPTALGVMA